MTFGDILVRVKLSSIDLNVLVALDAILSEGNVTRAAARIGRSQPATSHALKRARAIFEDPLLVRVRGSLELTARARLVAPKLHRLLRELGSTLDAHADFDPAAIECVTIGATDYVGFVLLPHLFKVLEERAPHVSVRVRNVEGTDALEPLVTGVLDLALGTFPQVPLGLRTEPLFEDDFVCVRRKTRSKTKPRVSLDEFARLGHVLVASPAGGQGPVDYALAKVGKTRHIAASIPQFLVAPRIVAETNLVLTTGRRIASRVAKEHGLEVFPCPVPLQPFAVRMLWHSRTEDDKVGQWLRALIRESTSRMVASEGRATKKKT